MKRLRMIVSICLVLTLLWSITLTSYATSKSGKKEMIGNEYSYETEFEGVKRNADGDYALEVLLDNETRLVPVKRVDFDLSNEEAMHDLMYRDDISEHTKKVIMNSHEQYLHDSNSNQHLASVFSQIIENESMGTGGSRGTFVPIEYSGMRMVVEEVHFINATSDWLNIANGTDTCDVAERIFNVALTIAGMSSSVINFISTGISLLSQFITEHPTVNIQRSQSDSLLVRITYDKTVKSAFRVNSDGSLTLGGTVESVSVARLESEQQYYIHNTGYRSESERNVNVTYQTSRYGSLVQEAYLNIINGLQPFWEIITWTIGETTYQFL